ncbi:MAG: hypothetical protein U0168_02185 [Nannocystaceae bacterium]
MPLEERHQPALAVGVAGDEATVAHDVGRDAARMHAEHAHARVRQLGRERLGEAADREFGRTVARLPWHADQPEQAREVDDVRVVALAQRGQEELAAVDHAPEVHADQPVEIREVELGELGGHGHAGVVDQDVDAAVLAQHLLRQRSHARAIRDVGAVARDPAVAVAFELVLHVAQAFVVHVDQRDVGARAHQRLCERTPDAAARTRDDRNPIAKAVHGGREPTRERATTARPRRHGARQLRNARFASEVQLQSRLSKPTTRP